MTDDLKERLLQRASHSRATWDGGELEDAALARITDLEARLAEIQASEEGALAILAQIIAERDAERAHADMLAEALQPFAEKVVETSRAHLGGHITDSDEMFVRYGDLGAAYNALAAYEARRKG